MTGARLGLGLAAIGRPGYITLGRAEDLGSDRGLAALEARAHALLDAAWAAGVRDLDTARSYGEGEAFLGRWLEARGHAPGEARVRSKWGYMYVGGWRVDAEVHEVKDHRLEALERQWTESLDHLGAHLELYQIHSATLATGVLEDRAVHAFLAGLRAERGVRIGLSLSGPAQADTLRRALEVEVDGAPLFEAVQATWNLLEPSAGPALAEAHARGLEVIVKEGVANGRLTPKGLHTLEDPRPLEAAAAAHDVSVDAIALAAALAQPWADVVLMGAVTAAQLQSNLRAREIAERAERAPRLAGLALEPEQYWKERSALPWA